MSLLTDTQGTPDRVWSLARLLDARGEMSGDDIAMWMDPAPRNPPVPRESGESALKQTIGAALSLGVAKSPASRRYRLAVARPRNLETFADWVHDRLCEAAAGVVAEGEGTDAEADSVLLEAYGATVALTEKFGGMSWLTWPAADRAGEIDHALRPATERDGARRFNDTKSVAWSRWMTFLGLGYEMPVANNRSGFFPYPAGRLLRSLKELPAGTELPVEEVLAEIARTMPYLDGGPLFAAAAERLGVATDTSTLSRVVSTALRDLHDDGLLRLSVPGDAASAMALAPDPHHKLKAVKTVTIREKDPAHA